MKQTELAKNLSVVWHPHPVTPYAGREVMMIAAEGYTIRQLLLNAKVDPYQEIVVYVDDQLIKVEEWDTLRPQDGQLVNVQAVVSGGGGEGSNPLQIVMMVAIVALTIYTGGATAGLLGTTIGATGLTVGMVAAAVISVAGSLLMSALFRPDGLSGGKTYEQASPTYSLTGSQNRARPYESMPVVMGTHRVVFDYASRPYTEYKGEDQYLYQIFHGGVSPTRYSDYKIGTNPLSNYTDVELFYPSDNTGALLNFPGNVDSTAGAPLTQAAGWITRTSSTNTYQLGVDVEAVLFQANDEGGLDSTSVTLEIEYKATSSGTWLIPSQIYSSANDIAAGSIQTVTETQDQGYWDAETGDWVDNIVSVSKQKFVAGSGGTVVLTSNTQKPRRVSFTFPVAKGEYDVRVRRTTADSTDPKLTQQTNWSVLKSYQVDETDYTGQTRIAMTIKASEQLNGTVSQFSALAESDALYWNGSTFVVAQTSNPAHLFTHFALGSYNGNGKLMYGVGLPSTQLDLPSLHAWATFCAAEGLTFNAVLDGNQTAADVLNAIARCGLGSPTWASGKLGVVWDYRNSSPVASFGMSNIIRDTFDVSYINENLAEEIVIRFRNPDKGWEQDEVRVLAPGVTDPLRSSAIDLFGCTDVDMAGKFANYLAAQQYYRRRRISWESDFEGFVCQRGDVVILSHDLTQWGYSGRIVSISGTTVTLDREVPRNGAVEYLMITEPDGTMTTYPVQAGTGDSDELILQYAPEIQSGYSLMDHRWSFSPLATPGKKVKILSIDPMSESRLRIVATDEFSEFYDAWDGTFVAPPDLTLLPPSIVEANNLEVVSRIAVINGYRANRVTASWGVGGGVLYSRVRAYFNGDLIAEIPEALVQSFEYDVYAAGSFYIEVTPFGLTGAGQTITSSLTLGALDAPPPPDSVTLSVGEDGKAATYTWTPVAGVQSYVIEIVVSGTARRTINVGNTLSYTYTIDDAIADGGVVRSYTFRVYSVANGIQSLTFASVAFSNPQIGALANARIEPMPNSVWFRCDRPTDADFAAIRVWISKTSGFTPSSTTVCYDGTDIWVNIAADNNGDPLESGVVYYVRAAGYDSFGDDNLTYTGEFSAAVLSPAWGLIQGDIDEVLLEAGLRDRIDLIDAPATTAGSVAARILQETTQRTTADTALSNSITTLQTTVNGQTASIQTNATSIDGINAKYTVKIDNNGYVSGYGLISTLNNATPTAEFAIIADRFSLAPVATNPNAVDGSPFFVLTAPQVISGVTIPAGSYMKAAFIHDATITTAKIGDLAVNNAKIADATIQNAKIANLSAEKINAGTLSADRIGAGSITAGKLSVTSLSAITANLGEVTAGTITAGMIKSGTTGNYNGGFFSLGYGSSVNGYLGVVVAQQTQNGKTGFIAEHVNNSSTDTQSTAGLFVNYSRQSPAFIAINALAPLTFDPTTTTGIGYGTTGIVSSFDGTFVAGSAGSAFQAAFGYTGSYGAAYGGYSVPLTEAYIGFVGSGGLFRYFVPNTSTISKQISLADASYSAFAGAGQGKIYIVDGNGPFTGYHEGLIPETSSVEIGDILFDVDVYEASGISSVTFYVDVANQDNQKGIIGVCSEICLTPPSNWLTPIEPPTVTRDAENNPASVTPIGTQDSLVPDGYCVVNINAVGEGQINVCGLGGNIEKGDLIVASSIAGKGMKQVDDIVRSYTVAKSRVNVTFDSPTQVKMIPCVYVSG